MNLSEKYLKEVRLKLMKELKLKNILAVPKLVKVTINVGAGTYLKNKKDLSEMEKHIALISGQKPVINKARKAISNFKVRIGMPVGVSVTLRGKRMYDFLERLINVVLPRVRDFQGISPRAFDQNGNYSFGLKDCSVFSELNIEDITNVHGLQITITTTARTIDEGKKLLAGLGMPFKKS